MSVIAPLKISACSGLAEKYSKTSAPCVRPHAGRPVRTLCIMLAQTLKCHSSPMKMAPLRIEPGTSERSSSARGVSANVCGATSAKTPIPASERSTR